MASLLDIMTPAESERLALVEGYPETARLFARLDDALYRQSILSDALNYILAAYHLDLDNTLSEMVENLEREGLL